MTHPWFYFGCGRESGHYLFQENGQKAEGYGPSEQHALRKALSHFDGVLPPQPERDLYVAAFAKLQGLGCCAISWWDRTVDKRPGSNSTIFAPGHEWTVYSLLEQAPSHFPWVFGRLPVPLAVLVTPDMIATQSI